MTTSHSNRVRWQPAERDKILELAGEGPVSYIVNRFNRWAARNDYRRRTYSAIHRFCMRNGIGLEMTGEYLTQAELSRLLGVCKLRVKNWTVRGLLPVKVVGRYSLIKRSDLTRLAKNSPAALAGIPSDKLFNVLDDPELAQTIANRYRYSNNMPRPVKCIETGRVFASGVEAAQWAHVTPSAIHLALRRNATSAGYHWEFLNPPPPSLQS